MSVLQGRTEIVVGVVIAIVLVAWMVSTRVQWKQDAREQLVTELQRWEQWEQHDDLLLETIDAHHQAIYDANHTERHGGRYRHIEFDEEGYRSQMYMSLREALAEHGHDDAVIALEQFRSRQRDRR